MGRFLEGKVKMNKIEKTIDSIQEGLVWFVVSVITLCIAVLFLFDVLAGTGTMLFLTGGKEWQSVVISLATTGLLFALMFIGYMMAESENGWMEKVGFVVLSFAFLIYIEDVIFDALLADILRYGMINTNVDSIQWMFRILLGGISTVGDALAVAMIAGMPVMKKIIGLSLKTMQVQETPKQQTQSPLKQENSHSQHAQNVPEFLNDRKNQMYEAMKKSNPQHTNGNNKKG